MLSVRGFWKFRSTTYTVGWNGVPLLSGSRLSNAGGGRKPTVPLDPNSVCPSDPLVLRTLARFSPGMRA